jgi:hypothetical protein
MKASRLVVALMLAGFAFGLTPATPAKPFCLTGPTCSTNPSICNNYCAQRGLIYDYCDLWNGCCYCIAEGAG